MSGKVRLACHTCDRQDFDGVDKAPSDWIDVIEVQSLKESRREVDVDDRERSAFEWYAHLGTCPNYQREEANDE